MESSQSLTQLPNIGKVVAEKLVQAGISTPDELITLGTEQAFIRLLSFDDTACLSELQAIEGAIQGIRWHNLPKERKAELKEFFKIRRL